MKRVISFTLAIIMITACFAGCENNKKTAEEPFSLPLDAVKVGENSYIINMRNEDGVLQTALTDNKGNELVPYFVGELYPIFPDMNNVGYPSMIIVRNSDEHIQYLVYPDGSRLSAVNYSNISYTWTANTGFVEPDFYLCASLSDNECELIDFYGNSLGMYNQTPKERKKISDDLVTTVSYSKALHFGVNNSDGKTVLPCEYDEVFYYDPVIVGRKGDNQGLSENDVLVICSKDGEILCPSGRFSSVSFIDGADTGVGILYTSDSWDNELGTTTKGHWVIDKSGNKLSEEYGTITRNDDGTFTAERPGVKVTLDGNGKIISE